MNVQADGEVRPTTPDTRARLAAATWACIRDGGIEAATSRAITSAAGANLGSITYHFGSKDELVAEVICTAIEGLIAPAVEALEDETVDPVGRIFNAVARLQESYAGSLADAPAYLEALVHSRRMPSVHQRLTALMTRLRALLAEQTADLRTRGFLPAWVEPAPMAGLLLAVAQGVVLQTVVDDAGPTHDAMAGQFAQLLIAGRADPG